MFLDTQMDIDDGAHNDNFICADEHDVTVLRFWFPFLQQPLPDFIVAQYKPGGRENSWLSFTYKLPGPANPVVSLKSMSLYGCFEPIRWRRWSGQCSISDQTLRLELTIPKFWSWPVERIDLQGWVTQRRLVHRSADGQQSVIDSVLCTIIVMSEESEALNYVDVFRLIMDGIGQKRSTPAILQAIMPPYTLGFPTYRSIFLE
jgi:hypothetical protein